MTKQEKLDLLKSFDMSLKQKEILLKLIDDKDQELCLDLRNLKSVINKDNIEFQDIYDIDKNAYDILLNQFKKIKMVKIDNYIVYISYIDDYDENGYSAMFGSSFGEDWGSYCKNYCKLYNQYNSNKILRNINLQISKIIAILLIRQKQTIFL